MEPSVLTVEPETPLVDVHRMFADEEIHGAPVVDENFRVCGIVSAMDLLRAVADRYNDFDDRMRDIEAADVMTGMVVAVAPEATAAEVAHVMRTQRVHRVLVIEDKELVGVISTFDLLAALEATEPVRKAG